MDQLEIVERVHLCSKPPTGSQSASLGRIKKQNADYPNTNTNPNLKIEDTFQNQFTLCGTCRKYCNKVWLQSKESLLKTVNISNCGLGKKTLQSIALKSANK